MLTIDGNMGEGGGQVLRTALTLSLCLGRSFNIINIRHQRKKPGLQPQHLAAVEAAAAISRADVQGARRDSQEIVFSPHQVTPGNYHFDIGTAGSTSLVLQTMLPALVTQPSPSCICLVGGTHNPLAPTFEFLEIVYLPLLRRMGARVTAHLERAGFYPLGGGIMTVNIEPATRLQSLTLLERGKVQSLTAHALLAHLPQHIAQRELQVLQTQLQLDPSSLNTHLLENARGQGNALILVIKSEHCNEVISGFGRRGLRAEKVAQRVADEARQYLDAEVPVGRHLADQLVLLQVLAGGGSYRTMKPASHTRTNIDSIRAFTGADIRCEQEDKKRWRVTVQQTAAV